MGALERTIERLKENGDYHCMECGHKAADIQKLVEVVKCAGFVVHDDRIDFHLNALRQAWRENILTD